MKTFTIIATLALALPAFADKGAAPAASDKPSAAVLKLMQQIMPKSQYEKTIKVIGEQLAQMMAERVPGLTAAEVQTAMTKFMPYEWIVDVTAATYSKRFTAKEMEDVAAFYQTPTGKKMAEQLPDIMGDINLVVQKRLQEKMPSLIEDLTAKHKAK